MKRLLLIEDEQVIRNALQRMLERNGYAVSGAASVADAEQTTTVQDFDLIISDLRLPGEPGTAIIKRAAGVPVLIMTSYASVKSAVDAMQQGANDYIAKPFKHEEFLATIERILAHDSPATAAVDDAAIDPLGESALQPQAPGLGKIVGDCPPMRLAFQLVRKVAPTNSTVLILGESGTGKELIARALHDLSPRHAAPLIAVNCAAIAENLIESELFGHARGAFTGAVGAREGLVEAADRGTLFLDEIGELPLSAQGRLLRVLQEGEVRRLGTAYSSHVDIRLIAATHRDLPQLVRDGLIRDDLYYRLRVMEIRLPPLRERGEDIVHLTRAMLQAVCKRFNRPLLHLPADTLQAIRDYGWPGNVRELENALERAVILAEGDLLERRLLSIEPGDDSPPSTTDDLSLDGYFRHFVLARQDEMTETEIARQLGISRKSLWERRQRLAIPRPRGRRMKR